MLLFQYAHQLNWCIICVQLHKICVINNPQILSSYSHMIGHVLIQLHEINVINILQIS